MDVYDIDRLLDILERIATALEKQNKTDEIVLKHLINKGGIK